jgi:hypothetical protein
VFYRWDTDGYYFFDGAATDDGQVFSGSGSWNGRIVGSDNGDSDFYISQNTLDDRPTTDGYKITFADNTDHFDIPSTTQAGWQVVGTSLGTFAYKVNANAVTELNLLGNVGNAAYRRTGDLYGIILLPESATNKDIEEARKLLVDRGAADGTAQSGSIFANWFDRTDIVEFKHIDTSSITYAQSAWLNNTSLKVFPALDLSNSTSFVSAWQNTPSLKQFPQDAKLGTEATNVSFTSAWQNSGLTSFSTPLPTATTLSQAWYGCSSLTSFSSEFPLVTYAGYGWINCVSLTSFSTPLPLSNRFVSAWKNCTSLTDFSADVFANWNPSSISSGVFNNAWDGCTSLTAQSVENILTSIDTSGKYATSTGLSGGTALGDATIDIDYDVSTGSLTADTLSAIETLNGRGWSVNINNEIIVPNILQLQPAAAYSLRSFDSDADPNVVNVRRSSDSALRDFTASEVSDGTLEAWVGSGNDGHVTTWYDQSIGGTNHATQTTASAQPKIVENGVLVTDGSGNPAIIGDGVDDTLFHPTLTNELDSSDFLVTAAYKDELAMGIAGAVPRLYLTNSSLSYNTLGTVGYPTQAGRNVISFQVAGNTQEVFGNGTSLGTASETQIDIGQNMFNVLQGGSSFSDGPLMEVVVFGDNQSANRTGIENNINDHFNIYS